MSDDGIGSHLVTYLNENRPEFPGTEIVDLGRNEMSILPKLKDRKKLIVVDCAHMAEAPGKICSFNLAQVRSLKEAFQISVHQMDLLQVMELASFLGDLPQEVIVFGIQPATVAPGQAISAVLSAAFEMYVDEIVREIDRD